MAFETATAAEKLIVFIVILVSLPVNAFLIAYFFNRRWYRRKKRAFLTQLRKWGLIESEEKYMKTRNKF